MIIWSEPIGKNYGMNIQGKLRMQRFTPGMVANAAATICTKTARISAKSAKWPSLYSSMVKRITRPKCWRKNIERKNVESLSPVQGAQDTQDALGLNFRHHVKNSLGCVSIWPESHQRPVPLVSIELRLGNFFFDILNRNRHFFFKNSK